MIPRLCVDDEKSQKKKKKKNWSLVEMLVEITSKVFSVLMSNFGGEV